MIWECQLNYESYRNYVTVNTAKCELERNLLLGCARLVMGT